MADKGFQPTTTTRQHSDCMVDSSLRPSSSSDAGLIQSETLAVSVTPSVPTSEDATELWETIQNHNINFKLAIGTFRAVFRRHLEEMATDYTTPIILHGTATSSEHDISSQRHEMSEVLTKMSKLEPTSEEA